MWNTKIYKKLDEIINNFSNSNNYVVFDCDNTILMNDIQFATTHYLLKFKKFTITPDILNSILLKMFPNETTFINNFVDIFKKAFTSDINSLEYLNFLSNFEDFIEYFYFKYKYCDFSTLLFYSMNELELRNLINEVINYHNNQNFSVENWIYEDNISSYKIGLKISKDMEELIKNLHNNNIDVYVISGSTRILVEEVLRPLKKYITGIYGRELDVINNKFNGLFKQDVIVTMNEGKSLIIDKYLVTKYKKGPIIVAGDSMGDYDMLTKYEDTLLSLIIDRNRKGNFQSLVNLESDRFLTQKVDETIGDFIISEKSITF